MKDGSTSRRRCTLRTDSRSRLNAQPEGDEGTLRVQGCTSTREGGHARGVRDAVGSRPHLLLLALCAALVGTTVLLTRTGFNPAGLRGLVAFLAACAFVLALTHPWQTTRKYVRLIYVSAAALVACVVLTNVFEVLAAKAGDSACCTGRSTPPRSLASPASFFCALPACWSACWGRWPRTGARGASAAIGRAARSPHRRRAPSLRRRTRSAQIPAA